MEGSLTSFGQESVWKVNSVDGGENHGLGPRDRHRWLDALFTAMIVISLIGLIYVLLHR
jgi:hypothetical protein